MLYLAAFITLAISSAALVHGKTAALQPAYQKARAGKTIQRRHLIR
ncbi:MAG: hypothetical protein PW788_15465 [Micavibrio sp.]|nr:hypothetical protein [Micavibrio sp.]